MQNRFELACLTHNTANTLPPTFSHNHLHASFENNLVSPHMGHLDEPRCSTCIASYAFHVAAQRNIITDQQVSNVGTLSLHLQPIISPSFLIDSHLNTPDHD